MATFFWNLHAFIRRLLRVLGLRLFRDLASLEHAAVLEPGVDDVGRRAVGEGTDPRAPEAASRPGSLYPPKAGRESRRRRWARWRRALGGRPSWPARVRSSEDSIRGEGARRELRAGPVLQARCYSGRRFLPLSSRGLGRRPLTAETGVRIPVAVLLKPASQAGFVVSGTRVGHPVGQCFPERFRRPRGAVRRGD